MPFWRALPPPPIRNFCNVQADRPQTLHSFVAGLLNPAAPVPADIEGRAPRRYAVYRNNVTVGLIRAMEANFPVVRRLLGEQYFAGLVREYVQKHPPVTPLMFQYGDGFAAFLEAEEDLHNFAYLGDVARLEQQMRQSHHEADVAPLAANDLATLPEETLFEGVLTPHPAAALLASPYALHAIYMANLQGGTGYVDEPAQAQAVLVTRPLFDVELQLLDAAQYCFFQQLMAQKSLGVAADRAAAVDANFDLGQAFGVLFGSGAFQSIHARKDPS